MELTPKLENLLKEYHNNKPKLGEKASLPRTIVSNALESKEQLDKLLIRNALRILTNKVIITNMKVKNG